MKKLSLSVLVIALALAVAVSFVAISHLLIKTGKENPSASIDVSVSDNDGNNNSNNSNSSDNSNNSDNSDNNKTESTVSTPVQSEASEEPKPEVDLMGGNGEVYHKEIQVFHAEYDENGEVTVKSANGDKVVAPGTENQYDLYVKNTGDVPIRYTLEAQSFLTVNIGGEEVQVPVDASFSTPKNSYILGDEDGLEHLSGLDGVTDNGGLSSKHQAKYTLTWSWPYGGDDEFDTLLGNLAAEDEELTVKVAFNVTAYYDPNAAGGTPMTGDNLGLWVALFVVSAFGMIILLFLRKNGNDEEKFKAYTEKI